MDNLKQCCYYFLSLLPDFKIPCSSTVVEVCVHIAKCYNILWEPIWSQGNVQGCLSPLRNRLSFLYLTPLSDYKLWYLMWTQSLICFGPDTQICGWTNSTKECHQSSCLFIPQHEASDYLHLQRQCNALFLPENKLLSSLQKSVLKEFPSSPVFRAPYFHR